MVGRKPHEPTRESRQLVQLHASIGTTQDQIAKIMRMDNKTLRKHYRDELDLAAAQANATIGGALFNAAKSGNVTAQIFWMKTRARWTEKHDVNHTSDDGSMTPKPGVAVDVSKMSTKALLELIAAADEAES